MAERNINTSNPEEIVEAMTDFVNTFSLDKGDSFVKAMARQHRTLQQSFTRLCLKWLEHISQDDYRTDPRNEASHKIAKEMIQNFQEKKEEWAKKFKPSDYISHI